MSVNKVILVGNVGKDPEVRYLEGNASDPVRPKVATFPLATSERYRDRGGELRENTEWHNIVLWRGLADLAERFIHKGTQIYVEGHLRTRQWTDQTGNKRYTTEIIGDAVQLLGRRQDNAEGGEPVPAQPAYRPSAPQAAQQPVQPAKPAAPVDFSGETLDDLPF